MDKSRNDKFVMPLVFEIHLLNRIPSLRWLTRASSLSIMTMVTDKGSFSRDQAYIRKWLRNETDLHQNKKNLDRPSLLANLALADVKRTTF